MNRYDRMFERLRAAKEGALVPFAVLGDPDPESSLEVAEALIAGGADALELGLPFSDPIADGPVIQAAASRALAAGTTPSICFGLVQQIRRRHPELPLGLLVYSNLVVRNRPEEFFARCADAGVDSLLIADIPSVEIGPFAESAIAEGLSPILIVPPNATQACLRAVAQWGRGYTYLLGRAGVTGTQTAMQRPANERIETLRRLSAPPVLVGFGISTPEHVRTALECGSRGAIVGSAIVQIISDSAADAKLRRRKLVEFVSSLKAATRANLI